jgi:excinuclease ABC subunit C
VPALLEALPAAPGVGQIQGPEGRNLVVGKPTNLRRWAGTHLGAGKPSRKGGRPPLDLRPVTAAVAYGVTSSGFAQRLLYERVMGPLVPLAKRRDLKPPAYLRLEPADRFPRLTVEATAGRGHYGPFRDRKAAGRALDALQRMFPLRPCDFVFEPDPALPLGVACLYAQVRSCAAPCLARIGEEDYKHLSADVAAFLADPERRSAEHAAWLPAWVTETAGRRGLVWERGAAGHELYPVAEGAVLEEHAVAGATDPADVLGRLRWTPELPGRDDRPWLLSWLHTPRRSGLFVVLGADEDGGALAARLRDPSRGVIL